MKIIFVVLNYNKRNLLKRCLESLNGLVYDNKYEVIVVDNGSTDGSMEMVKNEFDEVTLIEMGYNSGFCTGNNVGVKRALEKGADGVVILNNDTEVESGFLKGITKVIDKRRNICMVSPNILLFDDREIIDANGFMITPDGIGKNLDAGKNVNKLRLSRREVFCPTGAATFYSKEILEDILQDGQYFDEDYEYCYEELDMGWRARLRGWKCIFSPDAVVYHHKSATAGKFSALWAYYSNRNLFFNIIKNYPGFYVLTALFLSLLRYPLLFIGFFMKKGVGHKIRNKEGFKGTVIVSFKSIADAMKKVKIMMKKRKIIQHSKKVDRKEIQRWFKELGMGYFESIYK